MWSVAYLSQHSSPSMGWLAGAVDPGARGDRLPAALLDAPVLVIEDEAMIAWMLESLLEDMGFAAITVAARGEEAVEAAGRLRPGLIVSDINLGPRGIDGVAAAATIREALWVPVIFVTGHADADALQRIDAGVPGALVLRKPIRPEELRRAIAAITEQPRPC